MSCDGSPRSWQLWPLQGSAPYAMPLSGSRDGIAPVFRVVDGSAGLAVLLAAVVVAAAMVVLAAGFVVVLATAVVVVAALAGTVPVDDEVEVKVEVVVTRGRAS
mmetsp:Transcript_113228/g.315288  ORF Transcript_113228/g.315288 Transcript_113228/m.315288 type:complete len:104 (+) Transcript_113228:1108-1419(+)